MAESWTISVGGRVYGPYSLEQMQAFHREGRLADHSQVARAGEDQFHAANEDPALAAFFLAPQAAATEVAPTPSAAPHKFGVDVEATGERTHYVIIADMKSRSITGLEEEIFNLGQAHRFMSQAWILSSEVSINTIRHALVQKLGKIDTLFIVDAAHDKAAWFNFGPENDARVRRMWTREPAAARKAG
jgi:GYF domain 2